MMKSIGKPAAAAWIAVILLSQGACADMSARDKNIAIGAAAGGVAGSILTSGSALGTVGGAAVGGVVGNEISKHK
jgi:osmotically inducible lipoprotein OsmB